MSASATVCEPVRGETKLGRGDLAAVQLAVSSGHLPAPLSRISRTRQQEMARRMHAWPETRLDQDRACSVRSSRADLPLCVTCFRVRQATCLPMPAGRQQEEQWPLEETSQQQRPEPRRPTPVRPCLRHVLTGPVRAHPGSRPCCPTDWQAALATGPASPIIPPRADDHDYIDIYLGIHQLRSA